jgi:hypothetical protein
VELTDTGERLYGALEPLAIKDEENGFVLAKLCAGLAAMVDPIAEVVRDQEDETPGWAILFQIATKAPVRWLEWVAQFVGVKLTGAPSVEVERSWIETPIGFQRCSEAALRAAVQATLTGTKTIYVQRFYNKEAFQVHVTVLTAECASEEITEHAALSQIPAWENLTFRVVEGGTYGILAASHATYELMEAAHTSYEDIRNHPSK